MVLIDDEHYIHYNIIVKVIMVFFFETVKFKQAMFLMHKHGYDYGH